MPSGVNSPVRYFEPYPFFTKKADGAYIWDADNKIFAMVMVLSFLAIEGLKLLIL